MAPGRIGKEKKRTNASEQNTFVTDFMTFSLHAFMVMMMATMGRRRGTMERGVWGAHKQHRSIPLIHATCLRELLPAVTS